MSDNSFDTLDNMSTMPGDDGKDKLLANRYKILRKLGEGGMGMVYLAEDTELGNSKVAIKFIPPQLAGNVRAIKNLKKEAQTAMQLSHPNIVRLHDLHTDGHQKFLVMEYIEGKTLEEALAEKDNDKYALEELLPIAEQISAGLDYAHSQKVLHRDLKPSNIMIDKSGNVKLLDFGIAREIKDSYTRVTGQETSGTLPYMSPEQLRGQPPSASMDIYSFAAVLYECLCSHPPFYTGDIRHQVLDESPGELVGLPEYVNEAFQLSLSKVIEKRPINTNELVSMLKGQKKSLIFKSVTTGEKRKKNQVKRLIPIIASCLVILAATPIIVKYRSYKVFQKQEAIRRQQVELARQEQLEKERQARLEAERKLKEQQTAEQKKKEQEAELARQNELEKERQTRLEAERKLKEQQAAEQKRKEQEAELAKQKQLEKERQARLEEEERLRQEQERKQQEEAKKSAEEEAARTWKGTIKGSGITPAYKPINIDGKTLYVTIWEQTTNVGGKLYDGWPHLLIRKKRPTFLLDENEDAEMRIGTYSVTSSGSGHFELDATHYSVQWENFAGHEGDFVIKKSD